MKNPTSTKRNSRKPASGYRESGERVHAPEPERKELWHIPEPLLEFAHGQMVEYPRDGLYLFGPCDAQKRPGTTRYGVIGTREGVERFGRLDILVNNAGLLAPLSIASSRDIALDDFDRIMKVNVRGVFQCVRAAAPHMKKSGGGKIVNISSTTAFGGPPMLHYIASKGAVISMTYAMAAELGPDNICVNTLAVGFTESEGVEEQPSEVVDAVRAAVLGRRPIKKSITPDDMARAMMFLVTEESDFVTGHTLVVDGGFVMR